MVLVGGQVTTANLEWHSSTVPDGEILNSWIKFQQIQRLEEQKKKCV